MGKHAGGTKMPAEILNRQDKVEVTEGLEAEVKGQWR